MALAFETGGYGFAPALVPVDQNALQGLKPLSFSGGGQSPVQFKPLAGWSVPSSHPELIAQGISSGLGSIAQGIEAAYKSKEAKAEKQKDREYELQKYESQRKTKLEDEETLARFKASLPSHSRLGGGISPDYDSEEKSGDYSSSVMSSAPAPLAAPQAERYQRHAPIQGGKPLESINIPEEESTAGDVFKLNNGSSPLSSITTPVDQSAAPSPRGEEALRALSSIDWSKVQGKLGAGLGAGASPVDIPAQAPDWLRKPKAVTAPLSTLGGFSDQALENADKNLADAGLAYASEAMTQKAAGGVPKAAFKSYSKAKRYIDSQADNPNWYAESAPKPDRFGNFVIPWKHHDTAAMAAKEESRLARKEASDERIALQKTRTLNTEASQFQSHPDVKAFTAQYGMRQSFPRFVKDYDEILKNPNAAGVSDIGLMDMFGRAEGGGRITDSQAALIKAASALSDKPELFIQQIRGGAKLTQPQRDQMLRVIAEDHEAQANIANQAVTLTREKLQDQGIADEKSLPRYFIPAKTKWRAMEEIAEMKKNAVEIHAMQKKAEEAGDKKTSEGLKKQLEEIGKSAIELRKKIDKSKSVIINLDEIENTPQGWAGGSGAVIFQQP